MLEIEEKLKDDSYKKQLLESLHHESGEIKRIINSGLSPEDYKRYSKYAKALDSSIVVLQKHKI